MKSSVTVTAPLSSANLGPGYDVFAAALDERLRLEVERGDAFAVDTGGIDVPDDRENLCVRAFQELVPAEGFTFRMSGDVPVAGGMGSSGAAIVAGLVAANAMGELELADEDLHRCAAALEGHPDNVAASLFGGFVICGVGESGRSVVRIEAPPGLCGVVVVPAQRVPTGAARATLPHAVPLPDAVHNIANASGLALAIERRDFDLLANVLRDRLHQPHRARLYPLSTILMERAADLGAIGATISGAGPSILFWVTGDTAGTVAQRLEGEVSAWAKIRRVRFTSDGARAQAS